MSDAERTDPATWVPPRGARVERATAETRIVVELGLDGTGAADVHTGVGFFDHLLTSLAHHALLDLRLEAQGDLEVDEHHTVEDCGLALGTALSDALGDRAGIRRFGDAAVPMDEALARCALDLSGRPYAVLDLRFASDRIGELSTQLVPHVLESFARTAGLTLHLEAAGRVDHHVAEAAFKALARSLRTAVERDPRRVGPASTKGTLV
jgi:imidazoleglycerol-phosphate dehydratase